MKRDTVKTLAGLVVIAVIVIATFIYGNTQRQNQLKHEQALKSQQVADNTGTPHPSASPSASSSPKPSSTTTHNTAPVKSPAANTIQGGTVASPAPSASSGSGQVAAASSEPKTGGSSNPLPQTGPNMANLAGVAAIVLGYVMLRYFKRSVFVAVRGRR